MTRFHPFAVTTVALSVVFLLLGLFFLTMPQMGASFYGVPTRDVAATTFVRAIGLRDVALALYLLGLTLSARWRALTIVLTATLVIPVGDIALLMMSGTARPVHYLLHGASLLCFALLAIGSRRQP
ncbi:DUF4267 domain-containing protein [Sphingomonas sp. GM_Shp_1]|uniref:DUF4267 domain-containing protein n=1 Tax=Sphingomonas sp. GM_Shp_1 TaxID=2937381 RepID=UPI00226B9978|nr:DUF4267 domain-containing protein [Sphingomonas sp. GM_Shp_1]